VADRQHGEMIDPVRYQRREYPSQRRSRVVGPRRGLAPPGIAQDGHDVSRQRGKEYEAAVPGLSERP